MKKLNLKTKVMLGVAAVLVAGTVATTPAHAYYARGAFSERTSLAQAWYGNTLISSSTGYTTYYWVVNHQIYDKIIYLHYIPDAVGHDFYEGWTWWAN